MIARYRSGTSAFTARDAGHYTTITTIWSGRLASIQRPPASDAGALPSELHPGKNFPAAAARRRRTAASHTWPSPARPGCAVRGTFIPGGKLAPRAGFEPASNALTVRCLACSAIAEKVVDPLRFERRPDGLRIRCAAVTPRVIEAGAGRENRTRVSGLVDRGLSHSARPAFIVWHLRDESNVPIGIRNPDAGSAGGGVVPYPRNRTWSSRAYKARAVPSGP